MATKVFLKWLGEGCKSLTTGREYEHIQDDFPYVVSNVGESLCTDGKQSYWQRIERQTFEAHNLTWFRHVPGDAMPCDGHSLVEVLMRSEVNEDYREMAKPARVWDWEATGMNGKVGWRYADSEQKEPTIAFSQAQDGTNWNAADFGVVPEAAQSKRITLQFDGKLWPMGGINPPKNSQLGGVTLAKDESERNDLIAAVDDGHLTPGQKAFINAKAEKVAERLRSEAAKEELKRADHSKSIQDLANANGAVKFEHDHRLGWMQ